MTGDRVATFQSKKLGRYFAKAPEKGAEGIDGFRRNWTGDVNYCVPPVKELTKVRNKARKEKARAVFGLPEGKAHSFYFMFIDGSPTSN